MTEHPDDRVPPPDDEPVLPDQTSDDTDRGWGDDDRDADHGGHGSNDERLLRERPPHW